MNVSLYDYIARNPVNARIAENMVDVHILSEGVGSFEDRCCQIFSNAYDIIKDMIQSSPVSIWKIPDYYKTSSSGLFEKEIHKAIAGATFSVVLILAEHFDDTWISENQKFLDKMKDYLGKIYLSDETVNVLGNEIVSTLGGTTKCISAYRTLRRGTDIDYKIPVDEFINSSVGQISTKTDKYVTREDQEKQIEEKVRAVKAEIKQEIPNFVYDKQKRCINIVQGGDVDNIQSELTEKEINHQKEIASMKDEIERLRSMNNVLEKQNVEGKNQSGWYETDGNFDKLSEEEQITQRERLVFFATALSLEFNKKYTVAQNLGTFLKVLCNDNTNTLGPLFSRMKKPEEFSANKAAAEKVKNMLLLIIPKEYRNDQHLTINKIIKSLENNFIIEDE